MGLVAWIAGIGFCALGVAVGLWGLTELNKYLVLWLVGVPGAVALMIAAGLEIQSFIRKTSTREEDVARLRAVLKLDPKKIFESLHVEVGKEPIYMLRVKNTGKTRATNVLVVHGSASAPWPLPDGVDLTINPTGVGSKVLEPEEVSFWGTDASKTGKSVTLDEFNRFKTGALRFYVFGRITYLDGYGSDRFTNFCLSVVPPTDPHGAAGFGIQRCPLHNDSN